jgi:aryl-alcohol dehydrogenase-like predicted oxidoreductase
MSTFSLAGVEVPRVGLGTNRLTTAPAHVAFVREAVAAGVRHIDTALGGGRDDVLVATKGGYRRGEGRPEVLRAQVEQSLRSLRTDAIGLFYLHRVDPDTPLEESLGAIREHVDRGEIRHVGLSAVGIDEIERARRVVPIAAVQNELSLGERDDDGVIDHCAAEGIAFVPFFPLRGGGRGAEAVAARHGVPVSAVKLAWLLRRSPNVLPIPGTLSLSHLRENLAALDLELSDDDVAEIG